MTRELADMLRGRAMASHDPDELLLATAAALESLTARAEKFKRALDGQIDGWTEEIQKRQNAEAEILTLRNAGVNLLERAEKAKRERDEALAYIAETTKMITDVVGGGSELFVRKGEVYRADLDYCKQRLRGRADTAHEQLLRVSKQNKAVESALSASHAENARLTKLVKDAYNEAFQEGMREYTTNRGGKPWSDSSARAALSPKAKT